MVYTTFLEEEIIARMRIDNPWWQTGEILKDYASMSPRLYLDIFYPLVADQELRRAIILMGPRRVGKTVMIYHTIHRLITNGVSPQNIIYVSVETPIYNKILLERLFQLAKKALGKAESDEEFYVFFDEIQYLKDWEINLKSLVDTYRNVKFVASGSAAAELKRKSNESGAGRFTDFSLPPLLFFEYMHLKDASHLLHENLSIWNGMVAPYYTTDEIAKVNEYYIDYINYGGYPEVALSEKLQGNPSQFIRHDIIDKVLLRDLPSLYGITDVQELNSLFNMIAYHCGAQFSYANLGQDSGVNKLTLKKYIDYLEAAFLIKVIHRTDDTARNFKRDVNFKIYLTNPSLRCALFQPITATNDKVGDMVETAIYAQWMPRNNRITYANWKRSKKDQGEVDMVGINDGTLKPDWAVEIKWSDEFFKNPSELGSLHSFLDKNNLHMALVTSVTKEGTVQSMNHELLFIPAACYSYTVGKNTLNLKKSSYGL